MDEQHGPATMDISVFSIYTICCSFGYDSGLVLSFCSVLFRSVKVSRDVNSNRYRPDELGQVRR